MTDELSGRTLGRYQVLERLGRGGMAEVYRAYQPSLDRYVAIKVIYPHLAGDPQLRERFGREARAVAALRHPNIVQVHDFDMQGDMAFMAMEFIAGPTLKAAIQSLGRRGRLLPLPLVGQIVGQLADALAYAHEQHVVHRDVKPANVLLRRRGPHDAPLDDAALDALLLGLGPDGVVLTDFGVARVLSDSGEHTAAGTILGSPAYMAPEQGRGERADARSDIYSLGVVLYELLTGQVPFDADTPFAIVVKHNQAPLPPPRGRRPDLSEGLERVLLKALAKDPADRFQDAGAFAAAVREQTLQGSPDRPRALVAAEPTVSQDQSTGTATRYLDELHRTQLASSTPPPAAPANTSAVAAPAPKPTERGAVERPAAPDSAPKRPPARLRRTLGCLAGLLVVGLLMGLAFAAGGATVFRGLSQAGALTVPTEFSVEATAAAAQGTTFPYVDQAAGRVPTAPLPPAVATAIQEGLAACGGFNCPGGSASQAIAIYDTAIAANPESAPLYAARARAYIWWDPYTYREQIQSDVEAALERDDENAVAYLARGGLTALMAEDDGDFEAALEDLGRAIELDPALLDAYLARATLLTDAPGFYEPASPARDQVLADTTAALGLDPDNATALKLRGNALNSAGQPEKALADYTAALALDPSDQVALMRRADIYRYSSEDPQRALADYTAAVEAHPDYLEARRARLTLLAEQGEYEAARPDADVVVEREPSNPDSYHLRGQLALAAGEYDTALADFEQALLIAGEEDLVARYGRGKALLELGDPAGALPDLEAATEAFDELEVDWWIFFRGLRPLFIDLARALVDAGRTDEALEALDRAVELDGDWHVPYLLRGRLRALDGDTAGARDDLRAALELAERPADRQEITQALRELAE